MSKHSSLDLNPQLWFFTIEPTIISIGHTLLLSEKSCLNLYGGCYESTEYLKPLLYLPNPLPLDHNLIKIDMSIKQLKDKNGKV